MIKATKEENENQHTVPENIAPSSETYLENGKWKPVDWPTLEEKQKELEEKTLVGTARAILEQTLKLDK